MIVLLSWPQAVLAQQVTGMNVTQVDFAQLGSSQFLGQLRMDGPRRWIETKPGYPEVFRFEETGRSARGVQLVDHSRGVFRQIILSSQRIIFQDGKDRPGRELYAILGVGSQPYRPPQAAQPYQPPQAAQPYQQPQPSGGLSKLDGTRWTLTEPRGTVVRFGFSGDKMIEDGKKWEGATYRESGPDQILTRS